MEKDLNEEHGLFYITQNAMLFNGRGELLALRHFTGKWLLPGGRMNKGEDWQESLDREIQEETKIVAARIVDIFAVDSWQNFEGPHYGAFFIAETDTDKVELSDEHTGHRWLKDLGEIEDLEWWCPPLRDRVVAAWKKVNGEH